MKPEKNKNDRIPVLRKIFFPSLLFLGVFFCFGMAGNVSATRYYVSPTGSDANDGLSPETAWESTAKINQFSFTDGDIISLKSGGEWYRRIIFPSAGTTGITINSYDTGAKPMISAMWPATPTYKILWEDYGGLESYVGTANDGITDNWAGLTLNEGGTTGDGYLDAVTGDCYKSICMKMSRGTGSAVLMYQPNLMGNRTYTISWRSKSDEINPARLYAYIRNTTTGNYLQDDGTWSGSQTNLAALKTEITQTSWELKTLTFATENYSGANAFLIYIYNADSNKVVYLDEVELSTSWTTYSDDTYMINVATQPKIIWVDGEKSTEGTDKDFLNDHEWVWESGNLYYSDKTGSPATSGISVEVNNSDSAIKVLSKNYITLDGIHARGSNDATTGAIFYDGSAGGIVRNCTVDRSWGRGINVVNGSNDALIENNTITNNGHGVYPTGGDYGIFVYNSSGAIVRKNYVNNNYCGISINSTTNAEVYYNLVSDSFVNGIEIYRGTGPHAIYNNTSVRSVGGDATAGHNIVTQGTPQPTNVTIQNNALFCNNASEGTNRNTIALLSDNYDTLAVDYNIYYAGGTCHKNFIAGTEYDTLSEWQEGLMSHNVAGMDINGNFANPLFHSSINGNFNLVESSPAIDAGTDVGLTTDYAGNPIYGLPDIGAYEYQPPYTMGTDEIDIGSGARIYGDGKFRDVDTTSGLGADLSVVPSSGSFETYTSTQTRPAWLDISSITWAANSKEWTESNSVSGLTDTLHTVGDCTAGAYYEVAVDGDASSITGDNCTNGTCLADSNGKVTFTYTGSYSAHTFTVTPRAGEIVADLSNAQLKINRSNKTQNLRDNKKIWYDGEKAKLKGENSTVAGGTVKIYKEGEYWASVNVNGKGEWSKSINLTKNKTYNLELRFYDQFGTLRDTKEYDFKVDTEKPVFNDPLPEFQNINRNDKISFTAEDERSGMDCYKVKLLNDQGRIEKKWRKQNEDYYKIPGNVENGTYTFIARAYDKAGNYAEEKAIINVGNILNTTLATTAATSESPSGSDSNNPAVSSEALEVPKEEAQRKDTDLKPEDDMQTQEQETDNNQNQDSLNSSESVWWKPWTWF